jgi:anti-sigma regulatory factor (Ser/Thr protein kinase)
MLVTNAVKYRGDGAIELLIAQPNDRVRVAVRDPGGPGPLRAIRTPGAAGGGYGLRLVDENRRSLGRRARLHDRLVRVRARRPVIFALP